MDNEARTIPSKLRVGPWNKGNLLGHKPPLRPKHVWSIRTRLQLEQWMRDLAMFNLAIDSKLRGRDLVAIRVEDTNRHPNIFSASWKRGVIEGQKPRMSLRFGTRREGLGLRLAPACCGA
jgi:hypothetical protein